MLAIRSAVEGDLKFLRGEGSAVERLRMLRGYLTGVRRTAATAKARAGTRGREFRSSEAIVDDSGN
jgi:hypothetical protein